LGFVAYLHHFFPSLDSAAPSGKIVALAALWTLTAIHVVGVGPGSVAQLVLTALQVSALVIFVLAGFALGHGTLANFSFHDVQHSSAAVSLVFVLFSYSGWNAVAYIAGEMRDPQRSLPVSLLSGTIIVAALYVALNALYIYALSVAGMSSSIAVGEKTSAVLFGKSASHAISAILMFSVLASTSAMVLAGPRVYLAMARDGVLPHRLARIHSAFQTPALAIICQSAWASVLLVFFGSFERLVVYTGFALMIFSTMAAAAVIVLRLRRAQTPRPFRTPVYPWIPVFYVGCSVWIVIFTFLERPKESLLGIATVVAGLPLYFWQANRRRDQIH
jgi:APA family basic amino acid/polyamine antiporter